MAAVCEIRAEAPLSSKDFRGFTKVHSGVYQTDNFDSASKKIYIDVHAGVSSLSVRESGCSAGRRAGQAIWVFLLEIRCGTSMNVES